MALLYLKYSKLKLDKLSAIECTIGMEQRIVKIAQLKNNKAQFIEWITSLDKATKTRVQSRLTRLLENNFGDHKKLIVKYLNFD